jgi:DNA-binding transcriptional LysR family regulator
MNRVHLWSFDLNLLVVLDVLLQERSVTRAAERLGRTQSAISHALNRLRDALGDELLVRDGRRMRPTARAEALADVLPRVLDLLAQSLAESEPFDAASTTRVFRLAAPDFVGGVLPDLLSAVRAEAPGARVELVAVTRGARRDIAEGRYDGLVAPPHLAGEGLTTSALGASPWRVYGRADHPAFARWDAESWAAWPHLQVRTTGPDEGPVASAAARAGVVRSVGAVVPTFALAPGILARTDLLLTVPEIAMVGADTGLASQAVPFELPPMPMALHRSAIVGDEPGAAWFLERVEGVLRHLLGA